MTRSLALFLLLALPLTAGCAPSPERQAADEAGIQASLEAYLPRLAQAYATGDLENLEGYAAQKEIAIVEKRIYDLAVQGRVLEPTFRRLALEKVDVWNYANAYVTTVEEWDLRSYASGTRQLLAEEINQSNRVKYQLKRQGDGWLVLYRSIQQ